MDDKKNEVDSEKTVDSSVKSSHVHEESSNVVSAPKEDDSDKKNLTPDTVSNSKGDGSGEQGKQPLKDSSDDLNEETSKKTSNKSQTLFSDIESSEDSVGYEPKAQTTVSEGQKKSTSPAAELKGSCEEKKVVESEFELVDSDEEFLEEQLSQELKGTSSIFKENDIEDQKKESSTDIPEEMKDDESTEVEKSLEQEKDKSPISKSDLEEKDELNSETLEEKEEQSAGDSKDDTEVEKSEEKVAEALDEPSGSSESKSISYSTPISPTKIQKEKQENTGTNVESSTPKESSESVELGPMETDVEMAEEPNPDKVDGQQIDESLINESSVFETDKLEIDDSMQIEETVIEEVDVSEMEVVVEEIIELESEQQEEQTDQEETLNNESVLENEELESQEKMEDEPVETVIETSEAKDAQSVQNSKSREEEKNTDISNREDDTSKQSESTKEDKLDVESKTSQEDKEKSQEDVPIESQKPLETSSTSPDDKVSEDQPTPEMETSSETPEKSEEESNKVVLDEKESSVEVEAKKEEASVKFTEKTDKLDKKLDDSSEPTEIAEVVQDKICEESSKETVEREEASILKNDKKVEESNEKSDPIETQSSSESVSEPKEIDKSGKSPSESEELISEAEKKSEDQIPEVAAEVVIDKVDEVGKTTVPETVQKSATVELEVIEIDDDDEPEVEKKQVDKEETATKSDAVKETEHVTKVPDTTPSEDTPAPMEIDQEITAKKSTAEDQTSIANPEAVSEATTPEDEDEPLLMIDESHKEDNDNESNGMDNETATSAPTTTDSSSEGSFEVFYDKECVNYECKRTTKNFYRATGFAMNYFRANKKRTKTQFVCEDCYDRSVVSYEDLCETLKMKQPLLHGTTFKSQEFVEIIDSSDEEESDTGADKHKDEDTLPKESIEMLEAELEGVIRKVMNNVDIQNQLSWTKQILNQRLTNLQEDSQFVTEQLRALQKKADHMHNSLYQCPKIKLRQLTPLDLNSGRMYNPESEATGSIPPPGEIVRNPIMVNEQYYAVKTKAIASWVQCRVVEEIEGFGGFSQTKTYKIRFIKLAKYPIFKTVYAKHMAYYDPPNVRLPIGSRVIAYFDATSLSRGKEKMLIPSAFYPGIIAEPLKQSNKFRYLVFYDDGYFQYVNHKDVRLVCQASENVWEDVHHQSREFIHNYLTQYAVNRPMVQTQKGQSMLVDYNGKWIYARVIDVDCSLVQMFFEGQSRSEWIYRGSTRLGPVYKESNNLSQKNTLNATRRRTEPFIRYINGDESGTSQQTQEVEQAVPPKPGTSTGEIRSVAKKSVSRVDNSNNNNSSQSSTSQPVPTVRHLNNSTIFVDDDNKPKGKVVYYTARKNLPPRDYVPHICNPSCPFIITHNLSFYSPLAKPLLSGWERQVFRQKSKKFIVYRGPCGKRMRNIEELHRYLRVTDNELNVDNFDFSPDTNCLAEYVLEKCLVNKKDISCGKEKMPIPCVNYYDETMPPACEYSAVRIPTEGVPLNLDEEFLCGCDCEDDCSDKTKCACWQLTYAGAKYGMPAVPTEMVGYQYKRLYEHVPTGIYECNSRCKCKASCVNRVVQQPLQSKLQVFKTSNRGWGLRCINDVPRGSFICVYAGQMLTEQVANEGGLDAGDEYFAELDYIEVAEQIKEGYESDVQEPEEDEEFYNAERDDDDTDFRAPGEFFKDKDFNTRIRTRRGNKNSTDGEFDSQERQVISFEPNKTMDTSNEPNEKPTIRKLFGRDESCYVMDAKVRGNLGRYFNHSCSPNLFVQNVFVDTHDLRFPWVAFFASTHIRAGTELTWNYNYEVGVVPGKVLYCQCGAPNCRQRLL